MTIKHPFLFLCAIIINATSGRLTGNPNLSLGTRLIGVLFAVGFTFAVVLLISHLADLEEAAWRKTVFG